MRTKYATPSSMTPSCLITRGTLCEEWRQRKEGRGQEMKEASNNSKEWQATAGKSSSPRRFVFVSNMIDRPFFFIFLSFFYFPFLPSSFFSSHFLCFSTKLPLPSFSLTPCTVPASPKSTHSDTFFPPPRLSSLLAPPTQLAIDHTITSLLKNK